MRRPVRGQPWSKAADSLPVGHQQARGQQQRARRKCQQPVRIDGDPAKEQNLGTHRASSGILDRGRWSSRMITDPRAYVPAGTSIRAISLAAVLAALAPSAASALPPHGPTPPSVYLQPAQAEAPAAGERTVEDFKAALAEIKRRLAEQRQSLTTGDQAAAIAQEAKAARVQIERLTRSMADLRRERDAMRGELLDTRGSAEALQSQLSDAQTQLQTARSGAAEQVQALQLERDQAKAA